MMTCVKVACTVLTMYYVLKCISKKIGTAKPCHVNQGSDKKHHVGIAVSHLHPVSVEQEKGSTRATSKHYFKIQISRVSKKM